MEAIVGESAGQRWQAFMDAAVARVQFVGGQVGEGEDIECAHRLLRAPQALRRWEQELSPVLRSVANYRSRMLQVRSLRQASFDWVHRAAPFRYLRRHNVRGERRRRLVKRLYDGQFVGYGRAMVALHESYVRSVCHGFCAGYIGESMFGDPLYAESMQRYQALYMEYFRAFSVFVSGREGRAAEVSRRLLPMMKSQLTELRKALLEYPLHVDWLEREAAIRKPTGDTLELPRLDLRVD
jgi:hypothetical protein